MWNGFIPLSFVCILVRISVFSTCLLLILLPPHMWSLPILPLPYCVLEISLAIFWGKWMRRGANFSLFGFIYHYCVLDGCYLAFNYILPQQSLKICLPKFSIFFPVISSSASWSDDPVLHKGGPRKTCCLLFTNPRGRFSSTFCAQGR